ncbi:putative phosphatase YkrA [Enterococcus florum]|uniref:Putative phosphatase YkrA n=1 Tax=Enterococcus florum TaxID=2480627 RepID=A0A4P5PBB4_9ENTE|nr:HAD family hydrolase [Enterococcus florum]GCF92732.1 putative phosphatase YkrA [Enterococcus florum]
MEKKYIFFDIDGTLTDRKTDQIVPSAQRALEQLQANGHFVAIATGRAHYKAAPFMEEIGLENMVCCGGGGLVREHKLLRNKPLEIEKARALIHQAEELGYGMLIMLEDSIKVWAKDDKFREQVGERQEVTEYVFDPDLDVDSLEEIYKIYISISKEEEHRLTLKDTIGYLRFVPEYLIFQYDDKYSGIVEMMQLVGGELSDVVVFGDDTNDLVMFHPQWTNIAMGNAPQELKDKADYVTQPNVNDGIFKACRKFGWI